MSRLKTTMMSLQICEERMDDDRSPSSRQGFLARFNGGGTRVTELGTGKRATGGVYAGPAPDRASMETGARHAGMPAAEQAMANTCFNEGDAVTAWMLEWFTPFNELTETQREVIACCEMIRKAEAGTRLIEHGTGDDACVYLVEGVLELATEEGETISVNGGTRRSHLPISVLTPHVYDVTAITDVSIIMCSQRLVHGINEIISTYTGVNRVRAPAITGGAHSGNSTCTG